MFYCHFSRCPAVSNLNQLYRWEKQLENGGTRFDKLKEIFEFTYEQYLAASSKGMVVQDVDLMRWAIQKRNLVSLENFSMFFCRQASVLEASKTWIWKFKKTCRIASRKITRFVSIKNHREKGQLIESAEAFVDTCKERFQEFSDDNIFNTDQSGFNKELVSGRTLAAIGIKQVEAIAQSIDSLQHSYTSQTFSWKL